MLFDFDTTKRLVKQIVSQPDQFMSFVKPQESGAFFQSVDKHLNGLGLNSDQIQKLASVYPKRTLQNSALVNKLSPSQKENLQVAQIQASEDQFISIYLKPGFELSTEQFFELEKLLGRDVADGSGFINIYTTDPAIIEKAKQYIGEENIDEIPSEAQSAAPLKAEHDGKWEVYDWAGNLMDWGDYDSFEDAWGAIREKNPNEEDWQEYDVREVEAGVAEAGAKENARVFKWLESFDSFGKEPDQAWAEGPLLYSYKTVIAKRLGKKLYVNETKYSQTTTKLIRSLTNLAEDMGLEVIAKPENFFKTGMERKLSSDEVRRRDTAGVEADWHSTAEDIALFSINEEGLYKALEACKTYNDFERVAEQAIEVYNGHTQGFEERQFKGDIHEVVDALMDVKSGGESDDESDEVHASSDSAKQKASDLGLKAFKAGKKAVPAHDKELMDMLKGNQVGEGKDLLKAWSDAFHKANAAEPVKSESDQHEFAREGVVVRKNGLYFAQDSEHARNEEFAPPEGGLHHIGHDEAENAELGKQFLGKQIRFNINEMDDAVDLIEASTILTASNFEFVDEASQEEALKEFFGWCLEGRIENDKNDPEFNVDHYAEDIEDQLTGIQGEVNGTATQDVFKSLTKGMSPKKIEEIALEVDGIDSIKDGWAYYNKTHYVTKLHEMRGDGAADASIKAEANFYQESLDQAHKNDYNGLVKAWEEKYPEMFKAIMSSPFADSFWGGLNGIEELKTSDGKSCFFLETPGHGFYFDALGEMLGEEDGGFDAEGWTQYNEERQQMHNSGTEVVGSIGVLAMSNEEILSIISKLADKAVEEGLIDDHQSAEFDAGEALYLWLKENQDNASFHSLLSSLLQPGVFKPAPSLKSKEDLEEAGQFLYEKMDDYLNELMPGEAEEAHAAEGEDVTRVVFKKFPEDDGGDVIALFPDEDADQQGNIMSYQHVGQHGAASPELIEELEDATPEEYAPLKKELENLGGPEGGYKLEVVQAGDVLSSVEASEEVKDDALVRKIESLQRKADDARNAGDLRKADRFEEMVDQLIEENEEKVAATLSLHDPDFEPEDESDDSFDAVHKYYTNQWRKGHIRWFDKSSGEGMVRMDEGPLKDQSIFVHGSAFGGDVNFGQKTSFEVKEKMPVLVQLTVDTTYIQVAKLKPA